MKVVYDKYPGTYISYINDNPSDRLWCKDLDTRIEAVTGGTKGAVLYGSRDSFLPHYTGSYPTEYVDGIDCCSTDIRKKVAEEPVVNKDFLSGIIYREMTRLPLVYSTVDIAILGNKGTEVLLASKKIDEGKLRFVGGFVDPKDDSFLAAARRETYEETGGLEVDSYTCIGTTKIDDWRYRKDDDKIITTFYMAHYIFGKPEASDDIQGLHWVAVDKLKEVIIDSHKPLVDMLLEYMEIPG